MLWKLGAFLKFLGPHVFKLYQNWFDLDWIDALSDLYPVDVKEHLVSQNKIVVNFFNGKHQDE